MRGIVGNIASNAVNKMGNDHWKEISELHTKLQLFCDLLIIFVHSLTVSYCLLLELKRSASQLDV